MAEIQTMPRVFKLGPTLLEDPDPDSSPEEALALYRPNYPALAHCTLSKPRVEGERIVYEVQRPTATTKGGASSMESVEAEIVAWEAQNACFADSLADPAVIDAATRFMQRVLQRRHGDGSTACAVDPALIPMC